MPVKILIAEKGKEKTIQLSDAEYACCSTGETKQAGYHTWFEFYATHEQAQEIVERDLKGTIYLLRDDAFTKNGLQVHRVYLNNQDQLVRLASRYFDAWNHCQRCGSFDVSIYHQWMSTVFCHRCGLNRKYRPHNPGGCDAGSPKEPEFYQLELSPREISYEDAMPSYPPGPEVMGRYDLWRHKTTQVVYRPADDQIEFLDGKALFVVRDGHRTSYRWFKRDEMERYAVNQPIYAS